MSFLDRWFGKRPPKKPEPSEPFMEHPSGKYASALEAITDAMTRLDAMGPMEKWITFSGQGQGGRVDSYQMEDVPYRNGAFRIESGPVDVPAVLAFAGLEAAKVKVVQGSDGTLTLTGVPAAVRAKFLDAVFRKHFGVHPHEGESDYAVGAEW